MSTCFFLKQLKNRFLKIESDALKLSHSKLKKKEKEEHNMFSILNTTVKFLTLMTDFLNGSPDKTPRMTAC